MAYYNNSKNALKKMEGALRSLKFNSGTEIEVGMNPVVHDPVLRVVFKGENYKPNYNTKKGPLKSTPYYDIILKTGTIEQKSDAAREEDIKKIKNAVEQTLKDKASRNKPPHNPNTGSPYHGGGTRRRKLKRSSKTCRRR